MCNKVVYNKPKYSTQFLFSLMVQFHSFNSRQTDREKLSALIILRLSYFGESDLWKMEVLRIFGSLASRKWFVIHESWTHISTLGSFLGISKENSLQVKSNCLKNILLIVLLMEMYFSRNVEHLLYAFFI